MELEDVYIPKFEIAKTDTIVAAGSCFAQHIGKQFKLRGYGYLGMSSVRKSPVAR